MEPKERALVAPDSLRSLELAFGIVRDSMVYHWVSTGSWSLHELIVFLVHQKGACRLLMTTWSVTEQPLRALLRLKEQGLLLEAHCLLSERVSERSPGAYHFAQNIFEQIKLVRLHAKAVILLGEGWSASIIGSANLTRNPRYEAGIVDTHLEVAQFHERWILNQLQCAGRGTP